MELINEKKHTTYREAVYAYIDNLGDNVCGTHTHTNGYFFRTIQAGVKNTGWRRRQWQWSLIRSRVWAPDVTLQHVLLTEDELEEWGRRRLVHKLLRASVTEVTQLYLHNVSIHLLVVLPCKGQSIISSTHGARLTMQTLPTPPISWTDKHHTLFLYGVRYV